MSLFSFAAQPKRIYAYGLSSTLVDKVYTFSFTANETPTSGKIIFYDATSSELVGEIALTNPVLGKNEVEIAEHSLPGNDGQQLNWAVELSAAAVTAIDALNDPSLSQFKFYLPQDVAVDNSPESDFFGRVYVANPGTGSGYVAAGISVYDQELKKLGDGYKATGHTISARTDIHRLAVQPQTGKIYYAKTGSSTAIYELIPNQNGSLSDGGSSVNVISGVSEIKNANSLCFDENGLLWILNYANYVDAKTTGVIYSVDNKVATLFTKNDPNVYQWVSNDNAIAPDGLGGFWVAQYRANFDVFYVLSHVNKEGVLDFYINKTTNNTLIPTSGTGTSINASYRGHLAYYSKEKILAFGGADRVSLFTVNYNSAGKPTLTKIGETPSIRHTNSHKNIDGIAFDYAGNLYMASATREKLFVYSNPTTNNTCEVPAKKALVVTKKLPAATPVTITGVVKRAIQMGEHVIVLTHEADGTPHIYRVTDGVAYAISQEGVVARDPENLGDYLSISDIAVTEDGKLVACNYILCQFDNSFVDVGYKRGVGRYYIWDDLASKPKSWFTSQANGNYYRANVGQTMAVKGTSTNAKVLVSCFTNAATGKARHIIHTVQGGSVTYIRNNGITNTENPAVGASTYEFIASPSAEYNWIVDGDKVAPFEIVTTKTDNTSLSVGAKMDASILGTKYNGASILTIRGMHLMVAPYADADGKVAGMKVLDITKGLDAVELKATVDLTTPVAATAAATAVKADGNTLTITLVTDAVLHTLTATIEIPEEIVGVVKRAIQLGETTLVLTHEADGTPHIYRVTDGMAYAISLTGVVARDLENKGDYLSISDIAVTEDGKLVACNYIRCQYSKDHVDAGYKLGTSRFYIWDDITGDPSPWFTTQTTGNSNIADVGRTFALKGTSQNAEILVTAVHNNNRAVRMDLHKVVNGSYDKNSYFNFGLHTTAAYYKEPSQGVEFQLNASATIGNWYLEGELSEPSEFVVPAGKGDAYSASAILADGTLGKKYNGATYLTVNGKHLMVAPYADADGKVAGVRVMDITNGLAAAKWLKNGVLATPVAATAAATAVKADGNALTITLVTDATMHTFHIKLDEAPIATALNPYAYNLSATWDLASKTLTTNYTLNADAKEVYITICDGNVEYLRKQTTGIARGAHTYAITLTDEELGKLPQNRGLTWKVVVKSDKRTEYAECETNYSLYHPSSIDIDNNPKNKTFGTIIVAESMHKVKNVEGYLSSGYGAGIYVFNPDFTPAANGTNPGYNGGNIFTNTRADNAGANAYAPRRVRISDDGRIFVTSLNTNGDVLWEVNANNMNTWTKVFTGVTQDTNKDLVSGSTFVAGPNAGFDVRGSGDKLQLLMLSANTITYGNGQRGFRVSEYNLGTASTWSEAPSKAFPHENVVHKDGDQCYFIAATASQVQYDKDGGVWYIQYRGTTSKDCPGLVHFTAGGEEDYKELRNNTNNAGFRFNNDFTKVVIAGDPTVSGAVKAIVYNVSKDADGNPVLTEESVIDMSTVGVAMNDFAWDYANNLYVVGNNKEKVVAYAMPYSGETTTPCAEKLTIVAGWVPTTTEALNPFAYGLSSELIDGGMNLKINYSLNAPATTAQVIIMDGYTEVKAVACTDLTMGSHTITIPTEGLPSNTDLTWKIVVNGTSLDKVHEYATKHKFYHPSSVDVDNNPENETFGLVLVNEAMNSVKSKTDTYLSAQFGAGIFAFDPTFKNTGKYNGGIAFTNTRADNAEATAYAPRRIRISDDGRIFVTSLNTNGDVLWEVNPSAMNTWTPIFAGLTQDANKDLVSGETFVAGPNAGFDVRGSGDKLQLLMLSSNTQAFGLGQRGFRVSEYDLGNNPSWNTAPSKAFPHENLSTGQCYFINPTASQVQYDKDGGVWYIQYRAEATELLPTLVHFNKDGVEDFKWLRDGTRNAAFRFNNDFTKVAISDQQFVNFYTVSKDASGKPVLTRESGFSLETLGNAINDFAWDYANNFYAVSNSNEWAVAYRLPYDGEVTTPAASKYTFQVKYGVTIDENADNTTALTPFEGETVTATVTRSFGANKILTLTLPFDMSATQISTYFGNATVYDFYHVVDAGEELHLQFARTTSIEAGKPYIIQTTNGYDAEDGFTIEDVTIHTELIPVEIEGIRMVPVLDGGGILELPTQYYLSNNALYCAGDYNQPLLGLRAYFSSNSPTPLRARVVFENNEATSIPVVTAPENNTQKLIKNGQLIIIRGEHQYNAQGQLID